MSDKLSRARHIRQPDAPDGSAPARDEFGEDPFSRLDPSSTAAIPVVGKHTGVDRTRTQKAISETFPPGETSAIPVVGSHAGVDRTRTQRAISATYPPGETAAIPVVGRHAGVDLTLFAEEDAARDASRRADDEAPDAFLSDSDASGADEDLLSKIDPSSDAPAHPSSGRVDAVGLSAALMSVCTIISRLTGFVRTWAMAFALGATAISSSYQVANNLPNMLYELVVGGMIVTAFLPVYVSVKRRLGVRAGNEYASNLLTIVVVFLGVLSVLCIAFPAAAIYTQSFFSDQEEMGTATFFFQFFAIQLVFYGASAIVSGLLNANRDYLWSAIAPVANNLIVIATFFVYAVVSPEHPTEALYVIAIGNPLGVFVQLAIQLPALAKNGIRVRPHMNFRDPALRETLAIGLPAVFVMATSFAIVSVKNAAALVFLDAGPSVLAYTRLWFTLPYSFLAVPITTAMFTELSEMQSDGDGEGVKRGIVSGTNQILFFMIPFAFYLAVFSLPLVTLYHAGAFSLDSVSVTASYLSVYALALPFYGVNTYLQKIFSSLRRMKVFAVFNLLGALIQIGLTIAAALLAARGLSISAIAVAEIVFYLIVDPCLFVYLRRTLGPFGLRSTARAFLVALALGALGATAGAGVLFALETFFGALSGSIPQAFLYVVAGGVVSLIVTFGLALALRVPEAAFLRSIARRLFDR